MLSPQEIREVAQAGKDRDPGWYRIHRRLSIHISARLVATRVTLNQISGLMLALGVVGAALNASPHLVVNAAGWACLYGAFLLDKVDGEVARIRGQQSVIGILLDRFHHRLVEPLLFFAVGWRAFAATHSPLPLLAALATMLAANIIEETQQLPPFIAAKHARETRTWPVSGRVPSPGWERAAAWMRPLKTFRMFITVLPLVAAAEVLDTFTRWPATTWLLVTSAVALWVYVLFQSCYYTSGRLEGDIDKLASELPPLPTPEPPGEAAPAPAPEVLETAAEPTVAWPLPPRPRRSVTIALEHAEAERARAARGGAGPGPLVVLLLLGLLASRASAGTYYVDGSSPQCSPNGPGTQAQPYCTISAAIAARGTAGNTILVQPGFYRETVTFPSSGTSSAPIVLRANGVVTLDGADDLSSTLKWVQYSGSVWVASSVNWSPLQVFADGARLTAANNSPNALQPGTFRYVAGAGLYVNAGGGNPGTHGTLVGHRSNAFVLSGRSWITVDGFRVSHTEDKSFNITSSSSDLAVLNCTVTFSNSYGIYVNGSARVRVAGCVSTDNNNHGIGLVTGTTGCTIENNEGARNAVPGVRSANGIYLYGATGNTIRRNRWHDNQDTGEDFQPGANNNLSYDNVSWNNGDHGYDHLGASGNVHFNDVAYGNYKDGFSMEGTAPGTQLTNCIAVNNGLTTNEFDLWIDQSSTPGFVSNDNIFWNSTKQQPVKYIKTLYSTLAPYQAASGQDSRTLQVDPKFVNPAAGNFHLLAGSPAIDNGNSSLANWPATDADGSARVNDPATPDAGLGPIPWSDRGAYEYQPSGLPPIAALTATPAVAIAPAVVTLDASGSSDPEGGPLTYSFDFGDGTSAGPQSTPSIVHTYSFGAFTARVTVTDNTSLTATATATVIANQPPTASLAGTPLAGRSPLTVAFNGSGSSDADGTVTSYTFNFGDGTTVGPQASPAATHVYGTGSWQASLTVTDNAGAVSAPSMLAVTVGAPNQPPAASLSLAPSGGPAPLVVTANASGSSDPDGSIVSYRFDFGDGTIAGPQPGASATHTFAGGTYTVSVLVTDNDGATANTSSSLLVSTPNQAPNGDITAPTGDVTRTAGQSVTFAATGTDPDGNLPLSYAWDFGGGAPSSTQQNPGSVVFSNPGTYTVSLTVRDALGLADPTPHTRVITVTPADTSVAADNIHWTIGGQTSVTFDWRGPVNTIRFGLTSAYGQTVTAIPPSPLPYSSPGPYWEARLSGLTENTTYHYSIAGGSDHTFHTPPPRGSSGFTITAEGDIGDASLYPGVAGVQALIAGQQPAFVLAIGDLSYANVNGQPAVDRMMTDMQAWSLDAAFMPAWGNHEWESPTDDLRNYKGRFDLPNSQTTPYIPSPNDGGEDWYWFDYGDVRFIAYPEPFAGAWDDWYPRASALMNQAQADPSIHTIVTFGHRPAYSSGHHPGEARLKQYIDQLGAAHSKYVLNLNGHSHDYERTTPQSGVVHITAGTGGSSLEEDPNGTCVWAGGCPAPAFTAFRAYHRGVLRLRFTSGGIEGAWLCGPAGNDAQNPDDISCTPGTIVDAFTIGAPTPDRAPVVVAPATVTASEGGTVTVNVTATDPDGQPVANLSSDLSRLPVGNDAVFTPAPDLASGQLVWHPTYADSGNYAVTFSASNNLAGAASTALRILNTDRAPVVTAPGSPFALTEGVPFSLGVTAADADGDAIASLTAAVSPMPPGGALQFTAASGGTSGTLSWTPSFADSGTYTVTFTAANALQGTRAITLHVGNVDRPPALTAPASIVAPDQGPVVIAFTVSDPDSDAIGSLVANLSELPAGNDAVFTPGPGNRTATLTWTPQAADAGLYHVVFTATNALTASATTAISVNRTDHAPIITSPALVQASEGTQLTVAVSTVDPDSNAIATFAADLSGLPAGNAATFTLSPDHRNGVLRWTPGYQDSGSYSVRWIAANALADTARTTVHVNDVDRAPVVVAPASAGGPTGSVITVNVTASDPDGQSITSLAANLAVLPAGNSATFTPSANAQSGVFSWTPAAGDTGSYALTFTATNAASGSATTTLTVTRPNTPPTAVLTATPRTGNAPLAVSASGSGSSDLEGPIVSYKFDFGDGTVVGPQASATASHTYGAGTWTLTLYVTDQAGAVSSTTTTVLAPGTGPGTNLVGNPSFESNTNGWNAYSGSTYVRVAGGFDGGSSLQATGPASLSGFGINDSPNWVATTGAIGTRYRFGAWTRSATALGSARLQVREYVGSTKIGATVLSNPVQLTPNWQFVTVDYLTQAQGSTLDFQVYDQPVVQGEVFLTDNVSIYLVPSPAMVSSTTSDSAAIAMSGRAPVNGQSFAEAPSAPARFSVSVSPMLAAPEATLTFVTTRPGPVRIELYDLSGRRVRDVLNAPFVAPGLHNVRLDGRGDQGERLGDGVYFYRVQAIERSTTGRFVIVR